MLSIDVNSLNGTISIYDKFDITADIGSVGSTPVFNQIGDEYIVSFSNLKNNINKLTRFEYDTTDLTETRYLVQYYRISRNANKWTEWLDLKRDITNFPVIDALDPLYLDIKWVRAGASTTGVIRLLDYNISGTIERNVNDDDSTVVLEAGDSKIIVAPYIYKVFRIDDIEIISGSGIEGALLKYRFSQDNSRTWSQWEFLTKENISTKRITPTRFFQIEYYIENNSSSQIRIQDINIVGNFQNVSKDYFKSNLIGIRECCQSNINGSYDSNGNFMPNLNLSGGGISGSGDNCDSPSLNKSLSADEKSLLYNPYNQNSAIELLKKLSNDTQEVFGHKVIYFVTDPDKNGQDYSLHEYSLYNIVCESEIKVSVEGNNFPDSQIVMNQFDLNLFDTMEAHITKQQFKEIFGPQRRPSKEDFLYFCNVNRMYQVDHAQQFRSFNNAAVYYKLILKKYTQKANVKAGTVDIKNKLDMLTQNSTVDELFGIENKLDKLAIANKEQFKPLTRDTIRLNLIAKIDKELIENGSTIISKSNYDLSSIKFGEIGVEYLNLDPILKVSDNIGFQIWFNVNNYIIDEKYNMFSFYDNATSLGWDVNLTNDVITTRFNSDTYSFELMSGNSNIALEEETWYCYVLNFNQRNRKIEQYVYKRNVDDEEQAARLTSTMLRKIYSKSEDIVPIEYQIEVTPKILGSDMKVTNIRLFTDVIPEDTHNKILGQSIIREDSKYLVFADNANTRLVLPHFPLFE
jgi:hypothetical protein